jgi:protocatechuate 3,4-dioxygenase beta subunit
MGTAVHRRLGHAILVLLAVAASTAARSRQQSAQTAAQPQPAPTQEPGQIAGHIYRSDTKEPLAKAVVTLQPVDQQNPGYDDSQSVRTDASGAYHFANLQPGEYTLQAEHNGFVTRRYGQVGQGTSAQVFTLNPGQTMDKMDLSLEVAAVISGTVVDEDDEPVPRIRVAAVRPRYFRGGREVLQGRSSATTDDQGAFRISGLDSGFYYLQVDGFAGGLPMFGANRGGVTYRETFYPNALSLQEAQRLRVAAGSEVRGLRIRIAAQSAHTISGKIVDALDPSATSTLQLFISMVGVPGIMMAGLGLRPDGSFVVHGVPEGDYIVDARAIKPLTGPVNGAAAKTKDSGYGVAAVHVGDSDAKVEIEIGALAELRGSAVVEGTQPISSFGTVRVALSPISNLSGGGDAKLDENGTFDMKDIMPGSYTFFVHGSQSLYLRQAQCGGRDYTSEPLTVMANDTFNDCKLTLANDTATLSGQVLDGDTPVPNLEVLAVPVARDLRKIGNYTVVSKSTSTGSFQLTGLIPGDYDVFAVPPDGDQPYFALDFPERNQNTAARITIKPRDAQTITLKPTNPQ